jgi:hypothetical protein
MRIPRLSLRLALAVYTVTSIATATGASAETTANCGGQTTFVNTRQTDCPGQTLYDHLCLGPNGSHGIKILGWSGAPNLIYMWSRGLHIPIHAVTPPIVTIVQPIKDVYLLLEGAHKKAPLFSKRER